MNAMTHVTVSTILWSEAKDQLTDANGDVVIPHHMTVILDEDAGPLGALAIHGTLKASDAADVTLTADNVLVFGALEVGTKDAPHTRAFEIVLTGEAGDPDIVLADWAGDHGADDSHIGGHMGGQMGGHTGGAHAHHMTDPIDNKALIVAPGGKIDLHGADAVSWTQLDGTVEAGATSIEVLDASGWKVGDVITIAPTGLDAFEVEDRTITAIDGGVIRFDEPLEHRHFGAQQDVGDGRMLDMRAEVANLSRNIVVRGEEDPDQRLVETQSSHEETALGRVGYGGHVMVLNDAEVRIDGAEFTELGITGEIGRYPIHFHHSGDMTGSYVEDVSIHHTLQRGLVVHQTDNLLVKNSVVYDVMSHGIYIEDGVETGNRFEGNFVMLPRTTPNEFRIDEPNINLTVREAGENASGFWLTNVENEFEGNHVAAIPTGQGFWFIQPDTDNSHVDRSDPRTKDNALFQFEDNTAHTIMNDDAIGFLMGYSPIWTGVALDIQLPTGEDGAPNRNFTAWQVANMAIASLATETEIIAPMAADVRKFVHVALDDRAETVVENGVFVVKSDNMPDDVDVREYFQNRTNEGPSLSHAGTDLVFEGLNIVAVEHLHTAGDRVEDLVRLSFVAGEDGSDVYTIEDLAQDYRNEVPEELERGEAFFAYAGNDEVKGGDGGDAIVGGDGDERLGGQNGSDILVGGAGDDELLRSVSGRANNSRDDVYLGGVGDDVIDLGGKTSDERNVILFREGDGRDLIFNFDTEGGVHDEIALVGYAEADLDGDGDDADLALIRSDVEVNRFNKDVVVDLGGGDSVTLRMAKHKDALDAGDFSFIPELGQADIRVRYALELDAMPGACDVSGSDPAPEEPADPDPTPVDPDPVDPEPVDPDPVDPDYPDPVDPDPVDPVAPGPQAGVPLIDGPLVLSRGEAIVIDHADAFAPDEGSLSLSFRPDDANRKQTLFSKDSSGYDDGRHLGVSIQGGALSIRAQTVDA